LDWLGQEGDRVGSDGLFQSFGLAKGYHLETGREGPKAFPVLFLGAESDDGNRPAVEVVGADNDFSLILGHFLYLITPLAHGLNDRLHSLGPAVHGQDLVRVGQLAQFLVKRPQLIVTESPGGEGQLLGLLDHGLHDLGVAVALIDG